MQDDDIFVCSNGVTMRDVDCGVEYGYKGRTVQFVGEYYEGELSDSEQVFGYYERDDSDDTRVTLRDGRVFTLCSDEDYEALAKQLLSE